MDNNEINLGARIKYFRKRSGLKQMDLELRAGLPNGTISRIEHNKVNPSKETLRKIAFILKLNDRELDYLIGHTAIPASQNEIEKAIKDVEPYFKQKGILAYLADDRARLFKFSDTFIKLTGFNDKDVDKLIGHTVIELLLEKKDIALKLLPKASYPKLLELQMQIYISALSFMQDDYYFQKSMKLILSDPLASKIYKKLKQEEEIKLSALHIKKVHFQFVKGLNVELHYYCEPLIKHPRFKITEYIPTNNIIVTVQKIVGKEKNTCIKK